MALGASCGPLTARPCQTWSEPTSLALCNRSLFVDKTDVINERFGGQASMQAQRLPAWLARQRAGPGRDGTAARHSYFLLGIDTAVRLLDVKYYAGEAARAAALERLFARSHLICFPRAGTPQRRVFAPSAR